jgi:hypothetical protein
MLLALIALHFEILTPGFSETSYLDFFILAPAPTIFFVVFQLPVLGTA